MRSGKRVGGRGGRAPRRLVLAGDRGRRVPLARSQRARKTSPPPSLTTVRARARTWRSRSRLGPTFGWLRDLPPPASPALAAITQFPKLAKSIENEPFPPPQKNQTPCEKRRGMQPPPARVLYLCWGNFWTPWFSRRFARDVRKQGPKKLGCFRFRIRAFLSSCVKRV